MKELEWFKRFKEDLICGNEMSDDWELYCWKNCTKTEIKDIIRKLKKQAQNEKQAFVAAYCLGDLYYSGCKEHGIPVNYTKAIYWLNQAAQCNNIFRGEVLYCLANCYKYGRGANKDTVKAFKMFEALAAIDCSKIELLDDAEFTANVNISLADCYYRGIGTEKNVEKAIEIWKAYAEKGYETACRNLGTVYLSGKYVKRDYEKAFYWTKKAVELGDVIAPNNLGWCYEKGYGTEKDIEKAVDYYRKATGCGNIVAKNNLKRLKQKGIITYEEKH